MQFGLGLLGALGVPTGEQRELAVWQKGHAIQGFDPTIWRRDDFHHVIRYSDYGDRNSEYGWEIDHIVPAGLAGGDDLTNLRPLHFSINAGLGGVLGGLLNT